VDIFLYCFKHFNIYTLSHLKWRINARSGIRTHEANATDLKSVPFDQRQGEGHRQRQLEGQGQGRGQGRGRGITFDRSGIRAL
jgi:hypothetical protein